MYKLLVRSTAITVSGSGVALVCIEFDDKLAADIAFNKIIESAKYPSISAVKLYED